MGNPVFALQPLQREAFERQGFLIIPDLFSKQEVADMRAAFTRLEQLAQTLGPDLPPDGKVMAGDTQFVLARDNGQLRIQRICWCGGVEPTLLRVGQDPRILAIAQELLGSQSIDHLLNQAHIKKPGDQLAFAWHQDSSNRRYGTPLWDDVNGKGSYLQTALALDPVTHENGPLLFVSGSHKHGHLGMEKMSPAEQAVHLEQGSHVSATMPAGSLAVFGPFVIHSSQPNRSLQPRRLLINGYAYPEANKRVYPGSGTGQRL